MVSDDPFDRQFAAFAADMRASANAAAAEAGLCAVLHALILITLARLIDRLEHLIALWAAGQLPGLPARHQSATQRPANPQSAKRTPSRAPRWQQARLHQEAGRQRARILSAALAPCDDLPPADDARHRTPAEFRSPARRARATQRAASPPPARRQTTSRGRATPRPAAIPSWPAMPSRQRPDFRFFSAFPAAPIRASFIPISK